MPGKKIFTGLLALILLFGILLGLMVLAARWSGSLPDREPRSLAEKVARLERVVRTLEGERLLSARMMEEHQYSTCMIYTEYRLVFPAPHVPAAISMSAAGSGFTVKEGLVATNRHVLEPWETDSKIKEYIVKGAKPVRSSVFAFFPGYILPAELKVAMITQSDDVGLAKYELNDETRRIKPLTLASPTSVPYSALAIVGYPGGISTLAMTTSMVKTGSILPDNVSSLADAFRYLNHSLIRPVSMEGRLDMVVGNTLVYFSSTAHGMSGSPIFNVRGEVIGLATAFVSEVPTLSLGVSSDALKKLLVLQEKLGK
jgi:hypothetical protein